MYTIFGDESQNPNYFRSLSFASHAAIIPAFTIRVEIMEEFKDITVLSLEQATVLPYLTYRLAHDGVEVIRLEHPVYGDPNRLIGENILDEERMNAYFLPINAGKKALTLDLAAPEGRKIFHSLIKELKVDIFATNQLPRNYEKLGISYEQMKALKPDIIWLGVTGFGPESNEPAYDPILQARSGMMEMTGELEGDPQAIGVPLPDMGTSEHSYGLLMKALFKRQVTGKGSRIEMSMFESSVSWMTVPITLSILLNKTIKRRGNSHEFFCPVNVYQTINGFVYMAVGNDRQWKSMVSLEMFKHLDIPEYEKNLGRRGDFVNINQSINDVTQNHTSEELIGLFNTLTLPISKIKTIPEVIEDPLVQRRLLYSKDPKTGTEITLPPPPNMTPFLEELDRMLSFPPRFGEHNHEIYGNFLGYSDKQLEELKEKGTI
jgi:formyl-CoA transferase